jgi:uncharacterized protein (TIGR00255 family)
MATYSMTGFGRSEKIIGTRKYTVEVKSLNSKQLDLNIKIPSLLREIEMPLRTLLAKQLKRGKAELSISYESLKAVSSTKINADLMLSYAEQLKSLKNKLPEVGQSDWLNALIKLPEVLVTERSSLSEEEKDEIIELCKLATDALTEFRKIEGDAAEVDLVNNLTDISIKLEEVKKLAPLRIKKIRNRIETAINDIKDRVSLNPDRFEQELIFYTEKLDINEEIIRLESHLAYFNETLKVDGSKGKKLGFISQEIGREINTIGSKSNDATMQKEVVLMKDSLEKIKEQLLNVL